MHTDSAMNEMSDGLVDNTRARWARRACGTLAVGGGAAGLVATFAEPVGLSSMLTFAIWLLFALVYAAGVWIGVRLVENEPGSWKLLKAYMWMQVPVLQSDTVTYFFGSLMSYSWVYGGGLTFRTVYAPASGWAFSLFTAQPVFGIGVNVVGAGVLLALTALKVRP
jgi:hypothetical protein